jgi:DNA-binding FadR family transcriptional regulator
VTTPAGPLPPDRLHTRLARDLAREIVSGEIDAGETFPSVEQLAADAGVSRTVAREALQALDGAGLLSVQHGKRTVVNPVAQWRFLDGIVATALLEEAPAGALANQLYEARLVLEASAARLCAERASDDELAEIVALAASMQARAAAADGTFGHVERLLVEDLRFHALIAEGARNVVVQQLARDVRIQLAPTWALRELTPEDLMQIATGHRRLAQAMAARDADGAEALMLGHMEWGMRRRASGRRVAALRRQT